MRKELWYWTLPILWMGIIFYSSATPYEKQDLKPFMSEYIDFSFLEPLVESISFTYHQSEVSVAALGINGFVEFFIRKGAHVTVFFILFWLFLIAFRKTAVIGIGKIIVLSSLLSITYAIFDEIHQGLTPNRTPYIGDVILDSVGVLLAALLYIFILKFRQNRIID